jgi:hypothetical protein
MTFQAPLLSDDALASALFDKRILNVIRSGDAPSALALRDISLSFAGAQRTEEPRAFWKVGAAYFEAIALGLCPLTLESKRTTGQILLQSRSIARGEFSGLKPVLQDMVFYCALANPAPEVDAPALIAIRAAYGLGQAPVASLEDEQFKMIGDLRISIAQFNVYLNEADEWSRHLLTELSEWSLELDRPVFSTTLVWAHALSSSSESVGFTSLFQLADALEKALQQVQTLVPCDPAHARVFVAAAEEIRRLLHQFAAGFLKAPDEQLMADLQAVSALDLLALKSAGVDKLFQKEVAILIVTLGGALRQWAARPENLGARAEVLRVLLTLKDGAHRSGALALRTRAEAMVNLIERLDSASLNAGQMAPLLAHFESLQAAVQVTGRQGV